MCIALLFTAPAIAHADDTCTRWRIGSGVAGGAALSLIASGAGLDGAAYAEKQSAHNAPTLGDYKGDFREASRLSTTGNALVTVGIAGGFVTTIMSLVMFRPRNGCHETRRIALSSNGAQVRF